MRIVYYDSAGPSYQPGFRGRSEAWWVRPDTERPPYERLDTFPTPEALYQALLHLGLVDRLGVLPGDGLIGVYEEGELAPAGLEAAARLLREAADALPTGR